MPNPTDVDRPELSQADIPASPTPEREDEYAIVEIFGHRRHAGRIIEVERFGTKLLRIDVPTDGEFEKGFSTHFYGGTSIFSMTPCDLATVKSANRPYAPASRLTYSESEEPDVVEIDEDQKEEHAQ